MSGASNRCDMILREGWWRCKVKLFSVWGLPNPVHSINCTYSFGLKRTVHFERQLGKRNDLAHNLWKKGRDVKYKRQRRNSTLQLLVSVKETKQNTHALKQEINLLRHSEKKTSRAKEYGHYTNSEKGRGVTQCRIGHSQKPSLCSDVTISAELPWQSYLKLPPLIPALSCPFPCSFL